jgi:hypothetical protein
MIQVKQMKYYETSFDDYISSVERYNLHPELQSVYATYPKRIAQVENTIFYGPPGSGKYSQALTTLKRYSPTELKYEKKITTNTEKQKYEYKISDIHYEIDMSLLGCNSKILWHEIFFQIVDIVSVKPEKIGIILCKNFHLIHAELLDIFYSYIQHYNHNQSPIKIKFFIITEHISFIPTAILHTSHIMHIKHPDPDKFKMLHTIHTKNTEKRTFQQRITENRQLQNTISTQQELQNIDIINNIDTNGIINIKEIRSFSLVNSADELPMDIFNIVCDAIIVEMSSPKKIVFTSFRDNLYDILTYNLDITECLWYILKHFIMQQQLLKEDTTDILQDSYPFLKYYNNNYRPIYHLESIMFRIINKLKQYPTVV